MNIFDRDEIYKYLSIVMDDIFKKTKLTQERNFSSFYLIEQKIMSFFMKKIKLKNLKN